MKLFHCALHSLHSPMTVTVRSQAQFCSRLTAGIAGSNPGQVMYGSVLCLLFVV
jgi:hypothetical protein